MHSPQSPFFPVVRKIALDDLRVQAMFCELIPTKRTNEKTSIVYDRLHVDQIHAVEFGLVEDHVSKKPAYF